jgi:hypothetical protein
MSMVYFLKLRTSVQNRMARTLYIFAVMLAGLIPCLSAAQALATNPLDIKAKPYVDRLNKGLPTMVAATLRQERISIFNGAMAFAYTEVTKTAAQLAPMNLSVTQRQFIFPAICQAPDTGRMLREGYSFRYLYYGKDGKLAAQLVFLPVDCAAIR